MEIKLTTIHKMYNTMYFQSTANFEKWEQDGRLDKLKQLTGVNKVFLQDKHTFSVHYVDSIIMGHEVIHNNIVSLFNKLKDKTIKQFEMTECLESIDYFIRKSIAEQDYEAIVALKTQINERFKNR